MKVENISENSTLSSIEVIIVLIEVDERDSNCYVNSIVARRPHMLRPPFTTVPTAKLLPPEASTWLLTLLLPSSLKLP